MKIFKAPQHYIDWAAVGGYEKFIADYHDAPTYDDKRILIESLPLQTNPDWKAARRGHITASTMKDFLGMDRTGKKAGVGYTKLVTRLVAENTTPIYATRCSVGYSFAALLGSPIAGIFAIFLLYKVQQFAVKSKFCLAKVA